MFITSNTPIEIVSLIIDKTIYVGGISLLSYEVVYSILN